MTLPNTLSPNELDELARPKCAKCRDTGMIVNLTEHCLTGGPCDCLKGIMGRPLIMLRSQAQGGSK